MFNQDAQPLEDVLAERGSTYGPFLTHATISQGMMSIAREALEGNTQFALLDYPARCTVLEGIAMIQHKIARLVNGDPLHKDSWVDICGYATITYEHASGDKL
jgi:hypothetical protein